jgi:hypothetical protein
MKLLFNLILPVIVLSVVHRANAQDFEIFGKIIDEETKEVIPFANIAIKDIYKGTASNILGEFSFKVDSLPLDLIITHLSFETEELTVTRSEELVIELTPGKLLMEEVVITGAGNANFAYELVNKAYYRVIGKGREERYGKAFYRQISRNGDEFSELYEIFYDTRYNNNGVEDWAIQEGRYALKLATVDSFIYNKNFTLMVRLLTVVQPKTEDLIMPVSEAVRDQFDLRTERILSVNNRKVALISFKKKEGLSYPALEGELSIDIDTYEVLKIKGSIADDNLNFISLKGKLGSWKNYVVSCEVAFKPLENGQLALDYMQLQQNFDYYVDDVFTNKVETKSFFTYYEYYDPPKKKKLGGRLTKFSQRDSDLLDAIGYNQLFWDENIIVKRTPIEVKVTESFEKDRAFGSIYLNNKDQLILEDYEMDNDPFIVAVKDRLKDYQLPRNGEKVYIHHDKPIYKAGEDMWFKSYAVNMATNSLATGDEALHIVLISPEGKTMFSGNYKLKNGLGNGKVSIPPGCISGSYRLVAYTDYMLNFDTKLFFDKELVILNPAKEAEVIARALKDSVNTFRYFPEGGSLIENMPSQMGFVAQNMLGEPIDVRGRLLNNEGRQIANIKSEYLGFGSVFALPKNQFEYRTVIMSDEYDEPPFPEIKNEGYALMINNLRPNTIDVTVRGTLNLEGKKFYILVISNGVLFDRRIGILTRSLYTTEIPKSNMPSGIVQILLVDDKGEIRNKRLVFLNQPEDATVKYYLAKKEFKPRERIDMVIEVNDENGKAQGFSNVSVSILDKDRISRDETHQNIRSYFTLDYLLDYDVKTSGALFADQDRETLKKAEWIMLGQQTIVPKINSFEKSGEQINKPLSLHEGLTIYGTAKTRSGQPLANGFVSLIAHPNPEEGSWYAKTDAQGKFKLSGVDVPDSTGVAVVGMNNEQVMVPVEISFNGSVAGDPHVVSGVMEVPMDNETKRYFTLLKKERSGLSSRPQTNAGTNRNNNSKTPGRPFGKPDNVVMLDEKYRQYSNMAQLMLSKLPGTAVEKNDKEEVLKIKGNSGSPLIILDGLILNPEIVIDPSAFGYEKVSEKLKSVPVSDIDRIEIIGKNDYLSVFGQEWSNGVVSIYSREGRNILQNNESDILTEVWLPGFKDQQFFNSPNHSENNSSADDRTTLYWNPDITTNKKGRAKISFYNSDNAKNLQICVEGLTQEGMPVFDLYDVGKNYNKGKKD